MSCFTKITVAAEDCFAKLRGKPRSTKPRGSAACNTEILLITACAFALTLLDVYQLLFMILGGAFYALFIKSTQGLKLPQTKTKGILKRSSVNAGRFDVLAPSWRRPAQVPTTVPRTRVTPQRTKSSVQRAIKIPQADAAARVAAKDASPEHTPVSHPVRRYEFVATSWCGEVAELLEQIAPQEEHLASVSTLASRVQQQVRVVFPTAKVRGFTLGQLGRRQAFGVAVPDAEIVVTVDSAALREWHHGSAEDSCAHRKAALRVVSDKLVSPNIGFRFRRSAYRCAEPKVTLLADRPGAKNRSELDEGAIAMDLYVNGVAPGYGMALLGACAKFEPCCHTLFWLVRHWAKSRGICHGSQGHLTPFMWSLLVVYYLQTADKAQVPALAGLDVNDDAAYEPHVVDEASAQRASEMFKGFLHFYTSEFDWHRDVVSICQGRRITSYGMVPVKGIHIEDPWDACADLGRYMTEESSERLKQELLRADEIITRLGSMSELLQIWSPRDDDQPATC